MWLLHAPVTNDRELNVVLGDRQPPQKIRVQSGDDAILFERQADDVIFWARGHVSDVSTERVERTIGDEQMIFTRFSATVHEVASFEHHRSLADLRYSLERVRNFADPMRHFRLNYGRIASRDTRVITENVIHWSRTAIGMMAEAITSQDQLELARQWHQLPKKEARSHRSLARLVIDYIESSYGSFSRLLTATCDQAAALETWGELIVDAETLEPPLNLSNARDEAAEFSSSWTSEGNPFREMLLREEAPVFSGLTVDANEIQRLLLFR